MTLSVTPTPMGAFSFECCPYELWAKLRKIRRQYPTRAVTLSVVKRKFGFGLLMVCDNQKKLELRMNRTDDRYVAGGPVAVNLDLLMDAIQPTEGAFVRCMISAAPCGGVLYVPRTRDHAYIDGAWRDANPQELFRAAVPALAA